MAMSAQGVDERTINVHDDDDDDDDSCDDEDDDDSIAEGKTLAAVKS